MLTLLQHRSQDGVRRLIAVRDGEARFVAGFSDIRGLATAAIARSLGLAALVEVAGLEGTVDLSEELAAGRLLPPVDHPDSAHLVLTGNGPDPPRLGRRPRQDAPRRSRRRDAHRLDADVPRRCRGRQAGAWRSRRTARVVLQGRRLARRRPGEPLTMPHFAADGGEEPELAGVYLIGPDGTPHRLGFCLANEFSDHVTERHNYLWLAHSKLRHAALGAELLVGECPPDVRGTSRIRRDEQVIWEKPFLSGEANMSHSIANLEHHHFKYPLFRRPGDVHVHFFGTATLSFSDGIQTQPGDVFEIEAAPFALPLRNPLAIGAHEEVTVCPL